MPRVVVKAKSGMPVFLDEKDAAAFESGQKKTARGERPENATQRASAIVSKLLEMAKK